MRYTVRMVLTFCCAYFMVTTNLAQNHRDRYYYHDSIMITGVVCSSDLCLLTNLQYRGNSSKPHERSIVVEMKEICHLDDINDSLILKFLKEGKGYIHINQCDGILEELRFLCDKYDSIFISPNTSYSIADVADKFSPSKTCIIHKPTRINNLWSYQQFNTKYFLLVETTYRNCCERFPLVTWGDGIVRDFWLEETSEQPVIVVIPLSCDDINTIETK